MLTKRKIEVFKAIVTEFINTAEPVGSKTLITKYNLPYSSATIRNEMSDLEELGLLEKTHTSSGRVPSTKGYQFYVEHLMEDTNPIAGIELAISQVFKDRRLTMEEAIKKSSEIVSQMTQLTSIVLGPSGDDDVLINIELIPLGEDSAMAVFETESGHKEQRIFHFCEQLGINDIEICTTIFNERLRGTRIGDLVEKLDSLKPILKQRLERYELLFEAFVNAFMRFAQDNIYYSGEKYMMYQPEFEDVEKLKYLMKLLENSQMWINLSSNHKYLSLRRSEQSELIWLEDLAVISRSIVDDDDMEHKLMVVGPNRMEYERVISLVEYVSKMIETVYGKGGSDGEKEK